MRRHNGPPPLPCICVKPGPHAEVYKVQGEAVRRPAEVVIDRLAHPSRQRLNDPSRMFMWPTSGEK